MARQPPVLVAYVETTWSLNGAKSTPSVSWQAGDRIVVLGVASSEFGDLPVPTATGLTFTAGTPINETGACWVNTWTATAAADGSSIIDSAGTTGSGAWGMGVWVWRGSDGFGNRATLASTAKTVSLTRSQDESAVIGAFADFASSGTAGYAFTPTADNEREVLDTTQYTVFVADWTDEDAAGATSYGITGTASVGNHAKLALEILGAEAVPAYASAAHTAYSGSQVTSFAVTKPSGVVDGSTCVVFLLFEHQPPAPASITPPSSSGTWTLVHNGAAVQGDGWNIRLVVYEYRAGPSEPANWTFTWTNNSWATAGAVRVTGAASTGSFFDSPIDYEAAVSDGTSTPAVQLTTPGADRLLLWAGTGYLGALPWAVPSGFTKVVDGANIGVAWKQQAAAGDTGALTGSTSNSERKGAFLGSVQGEAEPSVPTGFVPRVMRRMVGRLRTHSYVVLVPVFVEAGVDWPRLLADGAGVTDSLSFVLDAGRTLADNANPTDAISRAATAARTLDDPANPSDLLAQAAAYAQTLADPAVPTDAISYLVSVLVSRNLDDAANPSDVLAAQQAAARNLDDPASPTDLLAATQVAARALDDTAAPTDAISYVLAVITNRAVDDAANPTDQVGYTAAWSRPLDEPASPTDVLATAQGYGAALADQAASTDALAGVTTYSRTLADGAGATDAISYVLAIVTNRTVDDGAGVTDAISRTAAFARPMDDSSGAADLLGQALVALRTVADSAAPTDQVSYLRDQARVLGDATTTSDALSSLQMLARVLDDPAGLSDALERIQAALRAFQDDAAVSDEVTGIALAGIVPTWRGRVLVAVGAQTRVLGTGPTRVASSGPSGVRGG